MSPIPTSLPPLSPPPPPPPLPFQVDDPKSIHAFIYHHGNKNENKKKKKKKKKKMKKEVSDLHNSHHWILRVEYRWAGRRRLTVPVPCRCPFTAVPPVARP